jgi:hypothetical protein
MGKQRCRSGYCATRAATALIPSFSRCLLSKADHRMRFTLRTYDGRVLATAVAQDIIVKDDRGGKPPADDGAVGTRAKAKPMRKGMQSGPASAASSRRASVMGSESEDVNNESHIGPHRSRRRRERDMPYPTSATTSASSSYQALPEDVWRVPHGHPSGNLTDSMVWPTSQSEQAFSREGSSTSDSSMLFGGQEPAQFETVDPAIFQSGLRSGHGVDAHHVFVAGQMRGVTQLSSSPEDGPLLVTSRRSRASNNLSRNGLHLDQLQLNQRTSPLNFQPAQTLPNPAPDSHHWQHPAMQQQTFSDPYQQPYQMYPHRQNPNPSPHLGLLDAFGGAGINLLPPQFTHGMHLHSQTDPLLSQAALTMQHNDQQPMDESETLEGDQFMRWDPPEHSDDSQVDQLAPSAMTNGHLGGGAGDQGDAGFSSDLNFEAILANAHTNRQAAFGAQPQSALHDLARLPIPLVPAKPPFVIDNIIPAKGNVMGGINICIFGNNFPLNAKVTFGGMEARILNCTATTVFCVLPPNQVPGVVPVVISGGVQLEGNDQTFEYEGALPEA